MSDTPRTDALLNNKEVVVDCAFLDFARQLERELAALRLDNLTAHKMACAAGIERDILRAELAAAKKKIAALYTEVDNLIEDNESLW